jgi:hypothetical protein
MPTLARGCAGYYYPQEILQTGMLGWVNLLIPEQRPRSNDSAEYRWTITFDLLFLLLFLFRLLGLHQACPS